MTTITLVRWGKRVNAKGALGRRLLRRYIRESAALFGTREAAAREWASYR